MQSQQIVDIFVNVFTNINPNAEEEIDFSGEKTRRTLVGRLFITMPSGLAANATQNPNRDEEDIEVVVTQYMDKSPANVTITVFADTQRVVLDAQSPRLLDSADILLDVLCNGVNAAQMFR